MANKHRLLKQLQASDLTLPNSSIFAQFLQSSIDSKSLRDGQRVHARLIKTRFSSETFILNRLIDMYTKCGSVDDAHQLFDKMRQRNTFSYNSMITGFAKLGFMEQALDLFVSMPSPDQISWNSIISGFTQVSFFDEALQYFVRMHSEDFVLNMFSFSSALSACAGLTALEMGRQIHASVVKSPFSSDVYMGSALVDMYSKCGSTIDARHMFDEMPERNVVSWNSLITCYAQNGPADEALSLFPMMKKFGIEPDEITFASVVSACGSLSAIDVGAQIHARVIKSQKYFDDLVLGNALVDMYAKCSKIAEARLVFDRMPVRNVVSGTSMVTGYARAANVKDARQMFVKMTERNVISWNALIAGYTQNGEHEEALQLFRLLKRESVCPTHYTYGNVLNACANLANLQLGKQAHTHILKHGLQFKSGLESDIFVRNSLVNMYAKCGSICDGSQVFEKMVERDIVSWNAMIVGYAQNGYSNKALRLFSEMQISGQKPDHITMIGVLCACSHTGLVEEGYRYFCSMTKEHGLIPQKDHYTCIVDLLGRAGRLDEVKKFIDSMPIVPDSVLWGSLLAACKVHRNIELGKWAAEKLYELDPNSSSPYVLLSNIYAELGRWQEVVRVRKLMKERGIIKQPGCSWIEIKSKVHVFMVKDKSHPRTKDIYRLLRALGKQLRLVGYVPDVGPGFREMTEEEKEFDLVLNYHSERGFSYGRLELLATCIEQLLTGTIRGDPWHSFFASKMTNSCDPRQIWWAWRVQNITGHHMLGFAVLQTEPLRSIHEGHGF